LLANEIAEALTKLRAVMDDFQNHVRTVESHSLTEHECWHRDDGGFFVAPKVSRDRSAKPALTSKLGRMCLQLHQITIDMRPCHTLAAAARSSIPHLPGYRPDRFASGGRRV